MTNQRRRLRQVCSHPCLITETSSAYTSADSSPGNLQAELARATQIMGAESVHRMIIKIKELTLRRIALEKESPDAAVEDEECAICMDVFTDPVVTRCSHVFCRACMGDVLNTPLREQEDDSAYHKDERPCMFIYLVIAGAAMLIAHCRPIMPRRYTSKRALHSGCIRTIRT
jgi:hypothetical protein